MHTEAYQLLSRLLREQTEKSVEDVVIAKQGKELNSEILQNPSVPDATYREKYTGNIGYVAKLVDSFNDEAGVIKHYDPKPSTYSDIKFRENLIDTLDNCEGTNILDDGAYYSHKMNEKVKEKGVELKPGQLDGKAPISDKIAYSEFEVDEESKKVTLCAYKEKHQMSYFSKISHTAKFKNEQCENSPLRNKCTAKKEKRVIVLSFLTKLIAITNYEKKCRQKSIYS